MEYYSLYINEVKLFPNKKERLDVTQHLHYNVVELRNMRPNSRYMRLKSALVTSALHGGGGSNRTKCSSNYAKMPFLTTKMKQSTFQCPAPTSYKVNSRKRGLKLIITVKLAQQSN